MELSNEELLAFVKGVSLECDKLLDQNDPESLVSLVARKQRARYENDETGDVAKTQPLEIGFDKVGYLQLRYSKPKQPEMFSNFKVNDYITCGQWLQEVEPRYIRKYIELDLKTFARWYFNETGEMPEGCELEWYESQAQPSEFMGVSIHVEPKDVLQAMSKRLPASTQITNLLGGDK